MTNLQFCSEKNISHKLKGSLNLFRVFVGAGWHSAVSLNEVYIFILNINSCDCCTKYWLAALFRRLFKRNIYIFFKRSKILEEFRADNLFSTKSTILKYHKKSGDLSINSSVKMGLIEIGSKMFIWLGVLTEHKMNRLKRYLRWTLVMCGLILIMFPWCLNRGFSLNNTTVLKGRNHSVRRSAKIHKVMEAILAEATSHFQIT